MFTMIAEACTVIANPHVVIEEDGSIKAEGTIKIEVEEKYIENEEVIDIFRIHSYNANMILFMLHHLLPNITVDVAGGFDWKTGFDKEGVSFDNVIVTPNLLTRDQEYCAVSEDINSLEEYRLLFHILCHYNNNERISTCVSYEVLENKFKTLHSTLCKCPKAKPIINRINMLYFLVSTVPYEDIALGININDDYNGDDENIPIR
ncbi:hypothetical protein HPULCUR_008721 [Helicostylum pulchrum]|uniref:Uncharacterized protein n=1 Tax=Helicostylum pulchrum TaxID=562976 RepID=A0ABP9Y8D9_9FUNG